MKNIRKFILPGISIFLLSCFAVTILPADILHEHQQSRVCKTISGQTCQHKVHINKLNNFCWVCAVHFDKSFILKTQSVTKIAQISGLNTFIDNSIRVFAVLAHQPSHRGPPIV